MIRCYSLWGARTTIFLCPITNIEIDVPVENPIVLNVTFKSLAPLAPIWVLHWLYHTIFSDHSYRYRFQCSRDLITYSPRFVVNHSIHLGSTSRKIQNMCFWWKCIWVSAVCAGGEEGQKPPRYFFSFFKRTRTTKYLRLFILHIKYKKK